MDPSIVFVSGHYPAIDYSKKTRRTFDDYTKRHGYGYFYDDSIPTEKEMYQLHFRRCLSIQKAAEQFPTADWYIWVDSDVFVNRPEERIESFIDLSDTTILYHLFHELPWKYPINTGVKIVNKKALPYEKTIYDMRNDRRWKQFPYEQNVMAKFILKQIDTTKYKIHDPYVLNCIVRIHQKYIPNALFLHMCGMPANDRSNYINKFIRGRTQSSDAVPQSYS